MEFLTKLEELVLISVLKLKNDACGTSIYSHIIGLTGREVTVSSVYFPLERLVRRGCLQALQGEPTPKRGGMGLSREFAKWVLLANAAAWPLAYFAMSRWLQAFAYRITIGPWMFLASGTVALAVALLTISARTIRAAAADPVHSLRYE